MRVPPCAAGLLLLSSLPVIESLPSTWTALGLDGDARPEVGTLAEEVRRGKREDYRQTVINSRLRAKRDLTAQLLRRELTLFEVAAWFRYLNEEPADCREDYRSPWPGNQDGELLGGQGDCGADGFSGRVAHGGARCAVVRTSDTLTIAAPRRLRHLPPCTRA